MTNEFETFRDPLLSVFQSVVDEVAEKLQAKETIVQRCLKRSVASDLRDIAIDIARQDARLPEIGCVVRPRDLTAGQISRICAELALDYVKALALGDQAVRQAVVTEYTGSTCDAEWLSTLEEYHQYFGPTGERAEIPYVRAADVGEKIIPIDASSRIALFADWGTGARPALQVLNGIVAHQPDMLIHLGDIYYSGTPRECRENFLAPIEAKFGKGAAKPVFSLSGNHDMYCGGIGFYDLIRDLNPAPQDQVSSFFCLRTRDEQWQFLALDTGLHDFSPYSVSDVLTRIEDDELAWHLRRMSEFGGKTILLSHHQLFSAYSRIGPESAGGKRKALNPNLLRAFSEIAAKGKIAAWFWGHEHSLSIYEPFAGLERGRCIGHGAIPISTVDEIYKEVDGLDETPKLVSDTRLGSSGNIWNHGYAVLSLKGPECVAEYYELTAKGERRIYKEQF